MLNLTFISQFFELCFKALFISVKNNRNTNTINIATIISNTTSSDYIVKSLPIAQGGKRTTTAAHLHGLFLNTIIV